MSRAFFGVAMLLYVADDGAGEGRVGAHGAWPSWKKLDMRQPVQKQPVQFQLPRDFNIVGAFPPALVQIIIIYDFGPSQTP